MTALGSSSGIHSYHTRVCHCAGKSDPLLAMAKALALAKTGLKLDCEAHKLAASKHDTNAEHFLEGCSEEEVRCSNYST